MTAEQGALIRYRLARARETLAEAEVMAGSGHWNACVNRLYDACFYAVNALLLWRGLSASRHGRVQSLFNRHFVKPGLIGPELAAVYIDLFTRRQQADYRDLVSFEHDEVSPWMPQAQRFVERIVELLAAPFREEADV